ncbi:uncharacterized protein KY384_008497 [Bacidia gigantensis]|uniref:uncharacterized protein n=1 Tax=Bacidia gigantensis TaxID=2732470 RepID=UPI001D0424E7|nr:uncharacterized protein KY384_008497 [Bacidia gigantensis]KAG8527068.1 hypothetical protein KY384_008497 [Bacidia gigantensis]
MPSILQPIIAKQPHPLILKSTHRSASTTSLEAHSILTTLLQTHKSAPPTIRTQTLDPNQLQKLNLTLSRPSSHILPNPSILIPPGYHQIYFTPAISPQDLGPDGADISYNPPPPFTRRMWAGGHISWNQENLLRVGEKVRESTRLISAAAKRGRGGEEMLVVGVEKVFENAEGWGLVDKRDWIFRRPLSEEQKVSGVSQGVVGRGEEVSLPEAGEGVKQRDFLQTPVSLFRFSALTFNAHMIHYSREWCREVEGHRDCVVHGPLNLLLMLDLWRDGRARREDHVMVPKSIKYRATAPFYVGEKYRGLLEPTSEGKASVKLWGRDGDGGVRVGMIGEIVE